MTHIHVNACVVYSFIIIAAGPKKQAVIGGSHKTSSYIKTKASNRSLHELAHRYVEAAAMKMRWFCGLLTYHHIYWRYSAIANVIHSSWTRGGVIYCLKVVTSCQS